VTVGQILSIFTGQGVALPGISVAAKSTEPFFFESFHDNPLMAWILRFFSNISSNPVTKGEAA
jgi:hypothetical protein